jgi:TRAP-type C4-dicarboxylate transport system substrate-binding protein
MKLNLVCFLAVLLFSSSVFSQEYTFKIATVAPEGSQWMKIMKDLQADIDKKTGGKVKFVFYSGSVAGDESLVVRKIKLGQYQGAGFTGVGLGQILPDVRVLEIPFHYKSYEQVDKVLNRLREKFFSMFLDKGFILLGWVDVGFIYVFSKKEIKKVDDMKSTKPWMYEGDPVSEATFKAFGLNPNPLSIADVLTSLQTGLIDTIYISPSAAIALQWYTKVKYMLNFPITNGIGALLISRDAFEKMPQELQATVKEVAKEHIQKLVDITRKLNSKAINVLKDKGITVIEPDPDEVRKYNETGKSVADKLVGKLYSKELLKEVRELIK